MSTSEASNTRARSYVTRPAHWLSDTTTGWIKGQYGSGSTKDVAMMFFFVVVVYAGLGGLYFYAIAAVTPMGMNGVIWGAAAFGIGLGVWSEYRARRHYKQRRRAIALREDGSTVAAGEAMGLIMSHDTKAQQFATATVAEATRNGGAGAVMKQADASVEQGIHQLAELLTADDHAVRLNAAGALEPLVLDYPEQVRQYKDTVFAAINRPQTQVQVYAIRVLGGLATDPNADPDEAAEFLDPLETGLNDDDHRVRSEACTALGIIDDERAIELLKQVQGDNHPEVREEANEALKQHRHRKAGRPSANASDDDESGPDDELIQAPPDMDFDDIAGMEELKEKLRERVIDPFSGADAYEALDVASEKGVLLHGPPGTGKTYVAKCLAGELGINYLPAGVGNVESKYTGEGVENIREVFDQAHRNQPSLIFLDEFDALAGDRSDSTQQSDAQKQVNQLLQELSDISADDDILVVAATNNPDQIDDAMLRTGRFDSKIAVPKPDGEARVAIFKHHLSTAIEPDAEIDVEAELRRRTRGCTASDMERIAENAARIAAKRRSNKPTDTGPGADADEEIDSDGADDHEEDSDTRIIPNGGHEAVSGERRTPTIRWQDIEQAIEEVARERGSVGRYVKRPPDMDFGDVAGMDALKDELREKVIGPLESPEMFKEFGVTVEKGFLLYGPSGTGKTHITRCLAGELDVTYIQVSAGDLVSKWIGEGAGNVQAMFEEARQNQPSLVFIDEIDALATSRGAQQTKSERQMVNQLLDEISAINDNDDDVIVIGATNRVDDVDDAMIRGGRLGERVEVPPPDAEARVMVFEQHLDAPHEELDRDRIASLSDGFVASDMEQVATNAARNALRRTRETGERTPVSQADVEDAIEHIRSRR